ncbi:synaptic vesicle transporter [Aureobasidium sp. EXF-3400]|nr:synaptic vesicle transporter [Aureobasidium sp. EXF-3400]
MQSYLQYRRLREDIQKDLAASQHVIQSSDASNTAKKEKDSVTGKTSSDQPQVPGVTVSNSKAGDDGVIFVVGWKENDPNNPQCWPMVKKWTVMVTCCILAIALTIPTSVEGPVQEAFDQHFHVNAMAGSMSTGKANALICECIFLIGIGVGSLFSGPLSETFGRNAIYFSTMILVMLFIMAKALAPNYGAALAFRFLCALFAATPMTVAGGTIGDVWTPMQIPFGLPFATFCAYAGPILGPVIGAYTPAIGFAWADWISMIIVAFALVTVFLLQPETFSPLLLEWRAQHLRELTGDNRYQAEHESASSLGTRVLTNIYRPFSLAWSEPIIIIFSFYLVLLYFVLFTFLNGYTFIFTRTHNISNGLTFILWVAMLPGVFIAVAMIPWIYSLTVKAAGRAAAEGKQLQPEVSLYWSTISGASILMPISLFWMAWTCYGDVNIWSPIMASFVFGYALVCIFTTSYMYIIFVYLQFAASALGFMTFARYIVSGALSPASVKMYENIGPHWSLTISAIVATLMAPVPFLLGRYGHKVRAMSKNVQNKA